MTENPGKLFTFQIDSAAAEERLDLFLTDQFDELSRSYIQKLSKDGFVLVNNKTVKSGYSLRENDVVSITIPEKIVPDILAEDIPLNILYEDEDVLIVNKPKGMVVHPAAGHYSGTLVNAIMYHCRDSLSGINGIMRPGIVHRIDKDTSGSLIICKNDFSHNAIAMQLKDHTARRIYKGIVCGHLKEAEGIVDAPIGRDGKDRKKMCVSPISGISRPAVTHYRKIGESDKNYDYVAFRLETGRTHQIRVHMASIHRPLLGDLVYGNDDTFHPEGQVLHAEVIGFVHPRTNEYMEFSAPVPEYFTEILKKLNIS